MADVLNRFWQGLQFYWGDISYLTVQHLQIVAVSGVLAIAIALPLGVWMSRPANQRYAMASMQVLNVGQAIPKLALLALAMSLIGVGSGAAIIGLFVATLLPVAVNTYEDLRAVPQHLGQAVASTGLTPRKRCGKSKFPMH
jgi:osmoprotectant transport system permease protein